MFQVTEKYLVDGFLILTNAIVTAVRLDNFTQNRKLACGSLNDTTAWPSGSVIKQRAQQVRWQLLVKSRPVLTILKRRERTEKKNP